MDDFCDEQKVLVREKYFDFSSVLEEIESSVLEGIESIVLEGIRSLEEIQ